MKEELYTVLTPKEIIKRLTKEQLRCVGNALEPLLTEEQKADLINKVKSQEKDFIDSFGILIPQSLMTQITKQFYLKVLEALKEEEDKKVVEAVLKCL
jgi:hypothetical protein